MLGLLDRNPLVAGQAQPPPSPWWRSPPPRCCPGRWFRRRGWTPAGQKRLPLGQQDHLHPGHSRFQRGLGGVVQQNAKTAHKIHTRPSQPVPRDRGASRRQSIPFALWPPAWTAKALTWGIRTLPSWVETGSSPQCAGPEAPASSSDRAARNSSTSPSSALLRQPRQ